MMDAAVRDLCRRVGVAAQWTDYANNKHRVPVDALRRILGGLGLRCETASDLAHSRRELEKPTAPPLIAATQGQSIDLPITARNAAKHARITYEDGTITELAVERRSGGIRVPRLKTPGYHRLEIGQSAITLAIAPHRCVTVADVAPGKRLWGLVAQVYGLRGHDDCGIGDVTGVADLAQAAASQKADALALSPVHALFAADPSHYSPYSPSSRLFYNPLYANPAALFGEARLARAKASAGLNTQTNRDASRLIDWPSAALAKLALFRRLFDDFSSIDLSGPRNSDLAADFAKFRAAGGSALARHALFEALHGARLQEERNAWSWRDWPARWRDPESSVVARFAKENEREILFHSFLQWIADRSLAAAQAGSRRSGMRLGLIADVAVGLNPSGSQAWANQQEILGGVQVGAPPDLFNASGQNWGLTTFSPRALSQGGFTGFIATLRACMRHAGGVRIDHAMGLMRLWIIPHGAKASEGAYLTYPLADLLRLTALESHRHRAIVVGEDLGTVPAGFRERLGRVGICGMGVLWFERNKKGFTLPRRWPATAVAMTSTHDLPTVAGWWRGSDLSTRSKFGLLAGNMEDELQARRKDRAALWKAFGSAKIEKGKLPAPKETRRVANAAVQFISQTPSDLALLPLEDALALVAQPNLPGTTDEHPNWRRRYAGNAATLLESASVRKRMAPLKNRAAQ